MFVDGDENIYQRGAMLIYGLKYVPSVDILDKENLTGKNNSELSTGICDQYPGRAEATVSSV
jgi:hypothetical protein